MMGIVALLVAGLRSDTRAGCGPGADAGNQSSLRKCRHPRHPDGAMPVTTEPTAGTNKAIRLLQDPGTACPTRREAE